MRRRRACCGTWWIKKGLLSSASAQIPGALEKSGAEPRKSHDLSKLKTILSTGSPLADHSFDYVQEDQERCAPPASVAAATSSPVSVLGNPIMPVYRGEIQTPGLGMAVDVLDDRGRPVRLVPGELVCTRPFPSMPVAFWDDPDGEKYRAAYFEYFSDVWRHGDWAEITRNRGYIIYGRSDATLNPGGVRIGTAEIYRQVDQMPEVLESVAVGQEIDGGSPGDVRIVLFVRLRPGLILDEDLRDRIATQLRDNTTPLHVPKKIIQVEDIPRTISGKISELAVREVIHGRPVKNTEALANPQSLAIREDAAAPRLARLTADKRAPRPARRSASADVVQSATSAERVSAGRLPARAWLPQQGHRPCPEASDRGPALEPQESAPCDSARRHSSRPTCAQR